MWVILHAVPDDIGHFVELSVIHLRESMENSTLNRFEAIIQVGDGPVFYYIRGVFQKVSIK